MNTAGRGSPGMPLNASPGPSSDFTAPVGFSLRPQCQRRAAALLRRLSVHTACDHRPRPIEVIVPEAWRMPLYRFINDPFKALQEQASVKATAPMADLLLAREAAA
jgi:hypothetical protein